MKKILIAVFVIVLILVGAAFAFIATFDLNRYRPLIVDKASVALGAPVEIGRISLVWRGGLALRLEDLAVYEGADRRSAFMKLKEVSAVLRLAPLLQKEVQIAALVLLSPEVHIVRASDGSLNVPGGKRPAPEAPAVPGGKTGGPSAPIRIESFKLRDGVVQFEDLSASPPSTVTLRDIDLDVKNFSLSAPFSFRLRASAFGKKQNVGAEGIVTLPQGSGAGSVEDFLFRTDLADLNTAEISRALPAFASSGIASLAGILEVKLERLSLDASAAVPANGTLRLTDGRIRLASVSSPFEDVQVSAALKGDDLRLENFSAGFAGGTLKANGVVKQWKTSALSGLTGSARDLVLSEMMPGSGAATRLNGRVSLDFEGQAAGLAWPQISQSLTGQGQLVLKEGVLLNYNILRKVLDKLSVIPGADGMIRNRLHPAWLAKLDEPSTVLKPLQLPFVVQGGRMLFDRLELATEGLVIRGAGQVTLADRAVHAKAAVDLDRGLSEMIVGAVPQIQLLVNPRGEVEVPIQLQGHLPQIQVLPDTEYIAQKLLTQQLTQFVENPQQSIQQVRNLLDKPVDAGESGVKNALAGILQAVSQDAGTQPQQGSGT